MFIAYQNIKKQNPTSEGNTFHDYNKNQSPNIPTWNITNNSYAENLSATSIHKEIIQIPLSYQNKDKNIVHEGYVNIRGIEYHQRIFDDNSAELTRFEPKNKRWVFLLFTNSEQKGQINKIKEAIKTNFDFMV